MTGTGPGRATVCQALLTALFENMDDALTVDEECDMDFSGREILTLLGSA